MLGIVTFFQSFRRSGEPPVSIRAPASRRRQYVHSAARIVPPLGVARFRYVVIPSGAVSALTMRAQYGKNRSAIGHRSVSLPFLVIPSGAVSALTMRAQYGKNRSAFGWSSVSLLFLSFRAECNGVEESQKTTELPISREAPRLRSGRQQKLSIVNCNKKRPPKRSFFINLTLRRRGWRHPPSPDSASPHPFRCG